MPNALEAEIRQLALSFPETHEESPWGDRVVKVRKKVFVFLGSDGTDFFMTVKLKETGSEVLKQSWASPCGYGLGRHGWVSMRLQDDTVPRTQLLDWLHESYRAVAPKTLIRRLEREGLQAPPPPPEPVDGPPEVILVGDDPLRLERAVHGLARRGVAAVCAAIEDETLDLVADAPVRAVVVDLGRSAVEGHALAERIGVLTDARLVLAGARDRKAAEAARSAVPEAWVSREAPGDEAVLSWLAEG